MSSSLWCHGSHSERQYKLDVQRAAHSSPHCMVLRTLGTQLLFFFEDMKHLQTLTVVMMTTAMVLAAPTSSPDSPKRNVDETEIQKGQIHHEAKNLLKTTAVRKQGWAVAVGETVRLFETCDANSLHFFF